MARAKLVKASLLYKDASEGSGVRFAFNPTEYTVTASASWKQTPAKGKDAPKSEFTGSLPRTLSMDIQFVDEWGGVKTDVWAETDVLLLMARPTGQSVAKGKPSAPVLHFGWASDIFYFDCHLKSASVRYTMFSPDGEPTRATASIVLEEVLDQPKRQNPTSGGPGDNRAHVVSDGDTLHSIAWREYDDASLWRGLADLNGIDDPMRLRTGQRLIVPSYEQAAARS